MVRQYRKVDEDFKSGAVRLVFETGKPMAQVARELGVNEGTLGNWVAVARHQRDGGDGPLSEAEWGGPSWRGCPEEDAELRMQRDVLIGHVEARLWACRGGRLVMSWPIEVRLRPTQFRRVRPVF